MPELSNPVSTPAQTSPHRSRAAELARKLTVFQEQRHTWELDRVAAPTAAELAEPDLALLLGASGSGKSTALAAMAASGLGVYVHARELVHNGTLEERLAAWARAAPGIDIPDGALEEAFAARELRLLLDGLDEIPRSQQAELSRAITSAVARDRLRLATVASRWAPAGLAAGLGHMRRISCPRLDAAGVDRIAGRSPLPRPLLDSELDTIESIGAGNPLLVELLCNQLAAGSQPSRRPVDLLMWSVRMALSGLADEEPSEPTTRLLEDCSQLAFEIVLSDLADLPEELVVEALSPLIPDAHIERAVSQPLLFRRDVTGRIGFRHRLVAEFLAAFAMRDEPRALTKAAEAGNAPEAIGFALEMAADPTASLITLGEHSSVHELQRFAPSIAQLPQMQRARARVVLVEQLRRAFTASEAPAPTPLRADDEAIYFEPPGEQIGPWPSGLLDDWEQVEDLTLNNHAKGRSLELFMATFFGTFFTVHRDIHSRPQIDLVLEITKADPFWNEYGALVPVECKNRRRKAEGEYIRSFLGAIDSSKTRLAFFVSRSGFMPAAWKEIQRHRGDASPVLVPLTGEQIVEALLTHVEPATFFRSIVREARFGAYR